MTWSRKLKWVTLFVVFSAITLSFTVDDWGFFAHRRINRMAVFTLPPEMVVFYKKNIEYITEHAIDPDKRRYASRHEGVRHYIDIDHWGTYPFTEVPRKWNDALLKYTEVYIVNAAGDTINIIGKEGLEVTEENLKILPDRNPLEILDNQVPSRADYLNFFRRHISTQYYEDDWVLDCDNLNQLFGTTFDCQAAFAKDRFSEYGILPYHLVRMQSQLTKAFVDRDAKTILRLSADFGHYIGDAHVPLHTTENYNGQLTDQVGIHAFWESRIPELFADKEYDFFVGKASYIDDPSEYYWDIVLKSHSYLDSVLLIEKDLRETFAEDKQFCFDQRLESTVRTQCREFARAYSNRMEGMVEDRMCASVHSIGSAWYTAWVDAGQPDLKAILSLDPSEKEEEPIVPSKSIKARSHDQ